VSWRRRTEDQAEQPSGPDPGVAWTEALERFSAMSVPERAAEVLRTVAPAISETWENASFKQGGGVLLDTRASRLISLLVPHTGIRPDRVTPDQHRTIDELRVTLAEALHALVLARLLIPHEAASGDTYILYANSPDGLGALDRGDVAEVVARRLPS
jgi:hypothetical protein